MPINNMKTWTNGTVVTAADLNAEVRDPINTLTPGHQVLTTVQRDALSGVTTGTMIYNSTAGYSETWDGTRWVPAGPLVLAEANSVGASLTYTLAGGFAMSNPTRRVSSMWTSGINLYFPYPGSFLCLLKGNVTSTWSVAPTSPFINVGLQVDNSPSTFTAQYHQFGSNPPSATSNNFQGNVSFVFNCTSALYSQTPRVYPYVLKQGSVSTLTIDALLMQITYLGPPM